MFGASKNRDKNKQMILFHENKDKFETYYLPVRAVPEHTVLDHNIVFSLRLETNIKL